MTNIPTGLHGYSSIKSGSRSNINQGTRKNGDCMSKLFNGLKSMKNAFVAGYKAQDEKIKAQENLEKEIKNLSPEARQQIVQDVLQDLTKDEKFIEMRELIFGNKTETTKESSVEQPVQQVAEEKKTIKEKTVEMLNNVGKKLEEKAPEVDFEKTKQTVKTKLKNMKDTLWAKWAWLKNHKLQAVENTFGFTLDIANKLLMYFGGAVILALFGAPAFLVNAMVFVMMADVSYTVAKTAMKLFV